MRLAGIQSGSGIMEVVGIDTIRGRNAWRLHFNIKGSTPLDLYHVDDSYDSWMDVESLNSLRFEQNLYEGGKRKNRIYDIFPDPRHVPPAREGRAQLGRRIHWTTRRSSSSFARCRSRSEGIHASTSTSTRTQIPS